MIERLSLLKSWGAKVEVEIGLPSDYRARAEEILKLMGTPLRGEKYNVGDLECHVTFQNGLHPTDLRAQKAMENYFHGIIEKSRPDILWAHYTDFFAVTSGIQWNADRTWVIITDNEYPRQVQLNQFSAVAEHYLKIKHIIVASRFMARSARGSIPWAKTTFIPNPIEGLEVKPVMRSQNYWLFVNPTQVKGVDFMIELAKALPEENFLFVGNWATELPVGLPKNVATLPRQNGLREVFSKSKGLLMPSVWQEAFGRIVLEAMGAGVPVVTSDRGSLPETVSSGGLVLPLDVGTWSATLRRPSAFWIELSAKGFERVKQYRSETQHRYSALRRSLGL